MKKLFFAISFLTLLYSCKKENNPTKNNVSSTIDTTSSDSAVVNSIDCSSVQLIGKLMKGETANSVSVKVNYSGGNGKAFSSQKISSSGVIGLTAQINSGILNQGNGSIIYLVSGTPSTSGIANFAISLGGKNCTISLNVDPEQTTGINFTSTGNPVGVFQNNITDIDGNLYKTVQIGSQIWMAENLKTKKYNDGTTIPNVKDNTKWSNLTTGAWLYYNNNEVNNAKYGKLYNWYAVSKTTNGYKNVCPTGWHIPTEAEVNILVLYLGGGDIAGGKMKEISNTSWTSPNTESTNTSLFTGLAGGSASNFGGYYNFGINGYWWCTTEENTKNAFYYSLTNFLGSVGLQNGYKTFGLSVRCLKD